MMSPDRVRVVDEVPYGGRLGFYLVLQHVVYEGGELGCDAECIVAGESVGDGAEVGGDLAQLSVGFEGLVDGDCCECGGCEAAGEGEGGAGVEGIVAVRVLGDEDGGEEVVGGFGDSG